MIVVMQPEATEADIEGVTEALTRHGLLPSVSRGAECTVIGAIGDVDAAGDLSQFSILPGVDKTVRISAPYKLVSSREGHRRSTIRVGPTSIGGSAFALIAGPCAVETPEQAAEACEAAAKAGATVLRGDVYKHRTSPYAFQGLGAAGLEARPPGVDGPARGRGSAAGEAPHALAAAGARRGRAGRAPGPRRGGARDPGAGGGRAGADGRPAAPRWRAAAWLGPDVRDAA